MTHETFDHDALVIQTLQPARRREIISAYLDDELSPEAARHVTAWLDAHPDALREVEHLRRVWDVLELYEDEDVPEGFAGRVMARVGHGRTAGKMGRRVWIAGLAAAAVALVAFGIVRWMGSSQPAALPIEPTQTIVLEEVPPELLEDVDVLLSMSDEEFHGVLLADLEAP